MNLLVQTLVFALISTLIGMVVSTLFMLTDPKFKWSEYKFWPAVAVSYLVTGAISYTFVPFILSRPQ